MITEEGIEGGAVYALSSRIRDSVMRDGEAAITIDLRPDMSAGALAAKLSQPRKGESFSNRLRKQIALPPAALGLLHEAERDATRLSPAGLADLIKAVPVKIKGVRPLDRAISTAGGIRWDELDDRLMLRRIPGVFAAGEMLDWEAPTGGYLLQACFATGMAAARGIDRHLDATLS
jgi:predicted flavoprotein YhiN